ncbi:MAG TPA: SAM-dependent methyltransferase [Chthoniobacterales bacterium]|nr:SAM-dependent methyltransferase [Chthoniobacterales bacterium]
MQTELVQFISDTIRARGPQSFAWFMRQALYHPQHGYYSSGRASIGRRGDYFTSVSVGPLFGRLLAAQFAQMWERLGRIDNFVIVEQGAHHGDFARDVLGSARKSWPEFFALLRYRIVEPFSILQDRQSQTLTEYEGKIEWRDSIDALEPFTGVHFSNELLDAMPVHLICSLGPVARATAGSQWNETFVDWRNDQFAFVEQPIVDPALRASITKLPPRPAGYKTEVNLAAINWIANLATKLERGYVLAVDYGFRGDEFFSPYRTNGTLQCRAQHRLFASPFHEIGHADITAHVDWTRLAKRAQDCGLSVTGFTDQHHFITGIISELLCDQFSGNADAKTQRALETLLHPEMLGRAFQVLALAKDVAAPLAGFKFARDAGAMLGL